MHPIQPWYWRSLPLAERTGSQVFAALFRQSTTSDDPRSGIATLLESPYPLVNPVASSALEQAQARYSICAGTPRVVDGQLQLWTPQVGGILPFLEQLLQRSNSGLADERSRPGTLPFTGGWLGWLGYDLAWEIERLPQIKSDSLPFPVAYWYEPDCFAVLDHWEQTLWLATTQEPQLDQLEERLTLAQEAKNRESFDLGQNPPPTAPSLSPKFHTAQTDYEAAVLKAKNYIKAGDIFQTNLSVRFEADLVADSWSLYRTLQHINPSPFASYWQTPWGDVVSCSPERLVQLQGRQAQTRPIAGTRSRGATPAQDQAHQQELLASAKEQAEHIMLVDLERNDLGRVCEWGSVAVNELLAIEHYSHVMHLVSNVVGTLQPACNSIDLIRSMFPGGTITGCPKVRCMEIIEELEPVRRSLFYGSCGYLDWRGQLDLNILIRTLLITKSDRSTLNEHQKFKVWGQVGAGIVADSDPEREWYESLHKAQAQLAALRLVELQPPTSP
ncbi:MAG: anthranilate synthase component I [Trichocoleus desertorum ATA4-8-CV12]|jgi:para-aminobenzoate synthetase component 1|nr:anthranilate synthase component I [Trichocoleus desertorum ATA4-8-CV12]